MTKIFKTFKAEEAEEIRKEICNSKLDLDDFFETKRKVWGVPDNYRIIGIDAYDCLYVNEKLTMVFKILKEEESTTITREFQNSKLDLETFFESKRKEWGVPGNYIIVGIDAYHRLFVSEK